MQKLKNKAFTLVELIVVITILTILGTIAFISLQGYSTNARDSTRISDMSSMKSSLELFHLDAGKYPTPTNGVNITFSGGTVWTQGSFGESVFSNVDKLNKIPTDPLTDKEYTYSITSSKNEYELGGMVEGDIMAGINPTTKVNAGDTEASAVVTGNYNGSITKVLSGTLCNILAVPTIITNDTQTSTDLVHIVSSGSLVYNGYKNLPATFRTSKFKVDGGFDFVPNNLIAYSDTNSCNPLIDKTSTTARVQMLKGIQNAYSGTVVQTQGEIKNILALVIDTNTPSNDVLNYAGNFVNNTLGGKVTIKGGGGSSGGGGSNGGGSSGGGLSACELNLTQIQVDALNTLFMNYEIDLYGDANWGSRIDPGLYVSTNGLSAAQYCNNVYIIDHYYGYGTLNSDLVQAYNILTNLAEVWYYNMNISAQFSLLNQINDLCISQNGNIISYNSLIWNLTNLKALRLNRYNNNFTSIPTSIGNMTELTEFMSFENNLNSTAIPIEIGNLSKLRFLTITNYAGTSLPSSIGNLNNLEKISISTSQLTSLPSTIGNLTKLTDLSLGWNSISTIPPEVGNLTNLKILSFYGNNSIVTIPSQIGNLTNLNQLNLSNNLLTSLPTELGNLTNLTYLGLSGNTGLGTLNYNFMSVSPISKTQGGMTIQSTGSSILISGTF